MESYESTKSLVTSKLRRDILGSLDEPMRLSELRRVVGANAPNTSAKAKDLQRLGLIDRDNGDFCMTHMGRIVHERLSLLFDTMETLLEHREFWIRVLDTLPEEIRRDLHKFKGAKLVRNEREHLHKVESELVRRIQKAKGDLFITLPADSKEIKEAIEQIGSTATARLVTLQDNPELRYGLIASNRFTILFTDMLDMALISNNSIQPLSFASTCCRTA